METNRLKQFCTIVETQNLRKASELLGISHSGLSKAMKLFEQELDAPLLKQSGRGIITTEFGMELYSRSQQFFEELDTLLGKKNPTQDKTIKIGTFEVYSTYLMGKVFAEDFPDYNVELHEVTPGQIEKALLNKNIDIGITNEPIPQKGIEYLKIGNFEQGVFCKKGAFKSVNTLDLPFAAPIMPLTGAPSGAKGLDAWPDDKFPRNIKYKVDMLETALELTRQGKSAVFVPKFVASLHNQIVLPQFQLTEKKTPPRFKIVKKDNYLVIRESSLENEQVKKLAKHLRKLCK